VKIRILHILHSLQVGGLENGVINLINNLDPDRFEHTLCCITTSGLMADRIVHPVEIIALGKGGGGDYLLPFKLARVITRIKPNIVHTRNWGTIDGVVAARLAGVHRVVHGEHGREAADPTGTNRRRLLMRKFLHPLVSGFVTVSADLKQWLVNNVGVPEEKVVQIINGVDTDRFMPVADKASAKTAMGLPPDSFVMGTVGRLDPVKNQQTLIRAFAGLITNKTNETRKTNKTKLLIVGSGPEESNLRKLTHDLGIVDRISFMGERKDIPELLRAMDLFVLPSMAEGISNTILEAMASGLPVVATNVGGNVELVVDGETGAIFGSGDYVHLSALLSEYATAPKIMAAQGRSARKRVEERFSLSRMMREYERLYQSVMEV
jgi:sugar transferase (PEP-CTERM/EpsH1 system associated)